MLRYANIKQTGEITMQNPTQYPELNNVLEEFVKRLKPLLRDNLLAVYLTGSFALGGADKNSDVDFLVVIEEDISDDLMPELEAMHRSLFEIPSYWSHHMEGSYFPKKLLKKDDPDHTPIVYIDNGSRDLERSTHDNELVVRWVTREHGITLYGEHPKYYIDPVPVDALKAEVKNTMHTWGKEIINGNYKITSVWGQSFATIMYSRMLHTLATGTIHSKPDAVIWGQSTLDEQWHILIQEAWQKRKNQYERIADAASADDISRTIEFIRYALNLSDTYR